MSAKWTRGTQHQRRPATMGRKRASQAVQESYQARGGVDGLACNQGTTGLARAPHVLTGREGYGFGVRQTHPHPVALTPVRSATVVDSAIDDLQPAAQSGSRRAMVPYDCPPSHLWTRLCSTSSRQGFSASAKATRKRRHLRQTATMHLKGINEIPP